MNPILLAIFTSVISLLCTAATHPLLIRIARKRGIVDTPNFRKTQSTPIPVSGGVAIFAGILISLTIIHIAIGLPQLLTVIISIVVMTAIGILDDIFDLSPITRLIVQALLALVIIYAGEVSLNNLHGLWGIGTLSGEISIPLTIISVIGIVNALNFIDGIDGLFAIFCICFLTIYSTIFHTTGDVTMLMLCTATIGALIPSLLYNILDGKMKMFIGDGGSLQVGIIVALCVVEIIGKPDASYLSELHNIAIVPFVLATLSMAIADALRVIITRICHGCSPLVGDRRHLHHRLTDMGISHIGAAVIITLLNGVVIVTLYTSAQLDANPQMQLYIVIITSLSLNCGAYYLPNHRWLK